jgi:hypothetical protein
LIDAASRVLGYLNDRVVSKGFYADVYTRDTIRRSRVFNPAALQIWKAESLIAVPDFRRVVEYSMRHIAATRSLEKFSGVVEKKREFDLGYAQENETDDSGSEGRDVEDLLDSAEHSEDEGLYDDEIEDSGIFDHGSNYHTFFF